MSFQILVWRFPSGCMWLVVSKRRDYMGVISRFCRKLKFHTREQSFHNTMIAVIIAFRQNIEFTQISPRSRPMKQSNLSSNWPIQFFTNCLAPKCWEFMQSSKASPEERAWKWWVARTNQSWNQSPRRQNWANVEIWHHKAMLCILTWN